MEEKQEITWGQVGRKLFGFLCGMKCSLILLSVILAACTAGSVVPQNQPQAWYEAQYGGAARWIMMFSLDDVFGCTWFGLLSALLALNLVLCSIVRFPHLWKQWRTSFSAQNRLQRQDASFVMELESPVDLQALGFRRVETVTDASGTAVQYAVRSRFGVWGSWLCHLGMLLIMGGFALGGVLATEDTVYGIPGSKQPIGDTGYQLSIDDFEVTLREDYTVEQYTAALTVTSPDGAVQSGSASVNHPMSAFGMSLYQDSTGWANYLDIRLNGELVREDLLCAGEYTYPEELPGLVLLFNKFYPDLVQGADGSLSTATPLCSNPHSLYTLYYQNQMLGMNLAEMGQPIQVDAFTFTMRDPVQYTLIVIRTDPTAGFVGAASLVMLLGILLAFYFRPQEVWTDGTHLWGRASKAPELLRQSLAGKINKKKEG